MIVFAYAIALVAAVLILTTAAGLLARLFDDGGPDTFGFGAAISGLAALAIVTVPLGLWKLVEILLWVWRHVHWGVL